MKVGTKSVLLGAHCFFIHPFFVAWAWWKLYGFPWDYRLWVAFFVHYLGYWGKPNMDGDEGETHPELGASIMHWLFDRDKDHKWDWHDFCLYHSRWYCKKNNAQFSKLCVADKLAFCLEWKWFYLLRVWLSGELAEYMDVTHSKHDLLLLKSPSKWFDYYKSYLLKWVANPSLDASAMTDEVSKGLESTSKAFQNAGVAIEEFGTALAELKNVIELEPEFFITATTPCPRDGVFIGIYPNEEHGEEYQEIEIAYGVVRVDCYGGAPIEAYGFARESDGEPVDEPPYWRNK